MSEHEAKAPAATGAPAAAGSDISESARAREVLEYLARQLVDDPDSVVIEVVPARHGTRLSLKVASGDMGKVIGRRGRVAQAIRNVVRAAGATDGVEVSVDIVD